jgi:ribonuclease HI
VEQDFKYISLNFIVGKFNMGRGTNNRDDFLALFYILKCVVDQNISAIQVFGDSKLTIDWMSRISILENMELHVLGQRLKVISNSFYLI